MSFLSVTEQNDASIIAYAGIGVAMGNAIDALKQNANEITLSNNEDGIAHHVGKILIESAISIEMMFFSAAP